MWAQMRYLHNEKPEIVREAMLLATDCAVYAGVERQRASLRDPNDWLAAFLNAIRDCP